MSAKRFVVLDGLRGLAAGVVLCLHLSQQQGGYALPMAPQAVDFFYMLSGFVVAFAYEEKLLYGTMGLWDFAKVRLVRLYPLVLLSMILGIALAVLAAKSGRITFRECLEISMLGLLLLPSFVVTRWDTAYPINGASWSLTFELFINAVYAVLARTLSTRRLVVLITISAVLLIWISYENQGISVGYDRNNFVYGFGRVTFPFFTGVLLYRLKDRVPSMTHGAVGVLVLLPLVLLAPVPAVAIGAPIYVILLFPAIVAVGAKAPARPALASICRIAGALSYPVYIVQEPVLRIGLELLKHLHLDLAERYLFGAAEAIVVVVAAIAATRFLDEPIQLYFRRRQRKQERSGMTTAEVLEGGA